jgi:hypothetical protein
MVENMKRLSHYFKINLLFLFTTIMLMLFNSPHVTYDGWQYISSGQSIFDGTIHENYFFVRKPLYPLFIGLCLKLSESLWTLMFVQTFLCVAAVGLLINSVVNSLEKDRKKRVFQKTTLLILCCFILGALPSFVLQQNAILILFAVVARHVWNSETKPEQKNQKSMMNWLPWTIFSWLAYLIGLEICITIILLAVIFTITTRITRKELLLILVISSILVITSNYSLNKVHQNAQLSQNYNSTNLKDPFLKENFIENLKAQLLEPNPPYSQKVIRAFLANLDLSPTVGWDGIYTSLYRDPGHPMAAFGLNHLLQNVPFCNILPVEGVIAVRSEYVAVFEGCKKPLVQVPNQIKPFLHFLYLGAWPLIVLIAAFGRSKYALVWLPGILLSVYALLGAGISRYGMVVYPIIIIVAFVNLRQMMEARTSSEQSELK